MFDLAATGHPIQTAWTSSTSENAWLALDRNGNGSIDNGSELFGNNTDQPTPPHGRFKNGFLALAVFDQKAHGGNDDGVIDDGDDVFTKLRLWQDKNHDGQSSTDELSNLRSAGIRALGFDYRLSLRRDSVGNQFRWRAKMIVAPDSSASVWAWNVVLQIVVPLPSSVTSSH